MHLSPVNLTNLDEPFPVSSGFSFLARALWERFTKVHRFTAGESLENDRKGPPAPKAPQPSDALRKAPQLDLSRRDLFAADVPDTARPHVEWSGCVGGCSVEELRQLCAVKRGFLTARVIQ